MDLAAARSLGRSPNHRRPGRSRLLLASWLVPLGWSIVAVPADAPPRPPGQAEAKARVAANGHGSLAADRVHAATASPSPADSDPVIRAKKAIADSRARFRSVQDYTCTFFKRERIDGKLSEVNIMAMKARTRPRSVYFKFVQPYEGREAIWVEGRNKGKVVAHEAGITKLVAGTMHLDPRGDMAMEENRHPITEAGIGSLIETVHARWEADLIPGVTKVVFHPGAKVGDRSCMMIETIHSPTERCEFSRVCLYIDAELGVPIRIESYGWPRKPGHERELMEEYTYTNLKLNPGLKDRDFDPGNGQYSYGRF